MVVEIEFNITPFKIFLGKVIPKASTEWFLIENYSLKDLSTTLEKYFYILEKEYSDIPNLEQLFHILCIIHMAVIKKAPKVYGTLNNVVVKEKYINDKGLDILKIEYLYDTDT